MPCHCPQCSPTPLRTWTPEFRVWCEAKRLLRLTDAEQESYLTHPMVTARAFSLMDAMSAIRRRRRDAAAKARAEP